MCAWKTKPLIHILYLVGNKRRLQIVQKVILCVAGGLVSVPSADKFLIKHYQSMDVVSGCAKVV